MMGILLDLNDFRDFKEYVWQGYMMLEWRCSMEQPSMGRNAGRVPWAIQTYTQTSPKARHLWKEAF